MTKEKAAFSRKEIARMHKVYDTVYDEHVKKGDTLAFAHLMAATKQTIEKNKILEEKGKLPDDVDTVYSETSALPMTMKGGKLE